MSVNVSPFDVKAGLPPSLRAIGAVRLLARAVEGGTEAYEVEESGPLRLRFPRLAEDALEAILINTGGGIAGGDRLEIAVEAGEGARVALTSQAAEKIYRATGPAARITLRLTARSGARLDWLPQETILFDRARVARTLDAEVAPDARLTICEAIVFGRTAMDERVRSGTWRDQWRIRRGGTARVRRRAHARWKHREDLGAPGFGRGRRRDRDPRAGRARCGDAARCAARGVRK